MFCLGKQKWVSLPLETKEGDKTETPSTKPQTNVKSNTPKANRTNHVRGNNRNRTRSLDRTTPKRNRKNRTNAAAAGTVYNAYQDYYSYYCMLSLFHFKLIIVCL